MLNRPSGNASTSPVDAILAGIVGERRRMTITEKIRGQTGRPVNSAERPSVHLRWGLQQMKLRGWTNKDWGKLFAEDRHTIGDGPVCILESVGSPMDAPGSLTYESAEQFYIRLAIKELGYGPVLYVAEWNDAQTDFGPIEAVMSKAIELAEADEYDGRKPYDELTAAEKRDLFGLTDELFAAEAERQRLAESSAPVDETN